MKKRARLGQHFLKARWAARTLVRESGAKKGETVLEIGPGTGILTRELLHTGARIIAVEKDSFLIEKLHKTFAEEIKDEQLTLLESDVRDVSPEKLGLKKYILAANIPYYITGEIIRTFLTAEIQPKQMALLVQKEVAERIARSKKESILSLSVKAYGIPKYIKTVSRSCFSPSPNVDSAILTIENISRDFFLPAPSAARQAGKNINEEKFFETVKRGFASKRKFLTNNLSAKYKKAYVSESFSACEIPEKARAEDVPLEKWKCVAKRLNK